MSFYFESTGRIAAVKAALAADLDMPVTAKALLMELVDDEIYYKDRDTGIAIKVNGHAGTGSYVDLSVKRFLLAVEPLAEVVQPPAEPAPSPTVTAVPVDNSLPEGVPISETGLPPALAENPVIEPTLPEVIPAAGSVVTSGFVSTDLPPAPVEVQEIPAAAEPAPLAPVS